MNDLSNLLTFFYFYFVVVDDIENIRHFLGSKHWEKCRAAVILKINIFFYQVKMERIVFFNHFESVEDENSDLVSVPVG